MDRRKFIISLTGLIAAASCKRPVQRIVSSTKSSEKNPISQPVYYYTTYNKNGNIVGLNVKTIDCKPIWLEGNSEFPINNSGLPSFIQAELYHLYSPERHKNSILGYANNRLENKVNKLAEAIKSGGEFSIIASDFSSPSLGMLLNDICNIYPNVKLYKLKKESQKNYIESNSICYDYQGVSCYNLNNVSTIISLGADIIGSADNSVYYSKWHSEGGKIWSITPNKTLTSNSSEYSLYSNDLEDFIVTLFLYLYKKAKSISKLVNELYNKLKNIDVRVEFADVISKIEINKGFLIIGANYLEPKFLALIEVINSMLNESYVQDIIIHEHNLLNYQYIDSDSLKSGSSYLLFNDGSAEALELAKQISTKVGKDNLCVLTLYSKFIEKYSNYVINEAHFLESWSDNIVLNKYYAISQPVIKPLNSDSISKGDLLLLLAKELNIDKYLEFQDFYSLIYKNINNDKLFIELLIKGYKQLENIEFIAEKCKEKYAINFNSSDYTFEKSIRNIITQSSNYVRDLNDADNPYLMEIVNPITLTAEHKYLEINEDTSIKYSLKTGNIVEVKTDSRNEHFLVIVSKDLSQKVPLVLHFIPEDRIIPIIDLNFQNFKKIDNHQEIKILNSNKLYDFQINFLKKLSEIDKFSVYKSYKYLGAKWGLIIDINKCTGCGACITACKIENNIPANRIEDIVSDKSMNWLEILSFTNSQGRELFVPYMCQHCESAPCETACPVNAVSHSPEGLNETTYNRCVGTRYCMAACQYKVRRFNYYDHYKDYPESLKPMLNPSVTVRGRGITEKCSLCVQILNNYGNKNESDKKVLPETACQKACAFGAIKLVDLNKKETKEYLYNNKNTIRQIVFHNYTNPSIYYIYDENLH